MGAANDMNLSLNTLSLSLMLSLVIAMLLASTMVVADGAACFSPDGKYVLTGGRPSGDESDVLTSSELKMWETESGQLVRTFKGHERPVVSVSFSPDGKLVLSASAGVGISDSGPVPFVETKLWDATSGREIRSFDFGSVWAVQFSPDGRHALAGTEHLNPETFEARGELVLWDIESGRVLKTFKGFPGSLTASALSADFSSDGKYVLLAGGALNRDTWKSWGEIWIWDVESGQKISSLKGHKGKVTSAVFSPDGKYVLSGSAYYPGDVYYLEGEMKLWDTKRGIELRTFESGPTLIVGFSPTGMQALGNGVLWSVESGERIRSLEEESDYQSAAGLLSPDGRYALSAGIRFNMQEGQYFSEENKLWDTSSGRFIRTFK